jgi:hypothetical protein
VVTEHFLFGASTASRLAAADLALKAAVSDDDGALASDVLIVADAVEPRAGGEFPLAGSSGL